jgi:DNA-directed RNA polymerase specialized sigma24 family protein
MWPSDDELVAAWHRLLADPNTAGEFAALVLAPLEADLTRRFRRDHPDNVTAAADEAVLAFLRRPHTFDPTRGKLPAFLRLAAQRDLINLRRGEQRHHRRRIPWEAVELTHPAGNEGEEERLSLADDPAVRAAIEALSADDRCVLELMRDGERETAIFAAALGLTDQPADVQFEKVKQAKDRVKARLKRAGGGR